MKRKLLVALLAALAILAVGATHDEERHEDDAPETGLWI